MTKITRKRLDEIRERAAKATEGPWGHEVHLSATEVTADNGRVLVTEKAFIEIRDRYKPNPNDRAVDNSQFIAHSRTDIPDLVEAVEDALQFIRTFAEEDCEYDASTKARAWLDRFEEEE